MRGPGFDLRARPAAGLLLAIGSCLAAYAVRRGLDSIFPPGFPFVTFFPAVIVTAYLAGRTAGLVSTVLCTVTAWYFFLPPLYGFALDAGVGLALGFFFFVAGFIALLISHMQVVTDGLERERANSARLYQQERVLFQELQHRVANNMQFVASLLHLQKRLLPGDPASADVLDEASRRIEVMSRVHRRLYDPSAVEMPLADYVAEICRDVIDAAGVSGIECRVDVAPVRFDIDRLMLLSLIIAEVVTNALKHAFVGRDEGTITLRLYQLQPGDLELTISDDGRGLQPVDPGRRAGLGTTILGSLASQLGGRISMTSDKGTTTRVAFPLGSAAIAAG